VGVVETSSVRRLARVDVRWHRVVVFWIVLVAAAARFFQLDLMEFKGDEAGVYRLALHTLGYSEPGVGRFFPTEGIRSSVGIPNTPLFVYLIALPVAVVRSPLAPVALIAALNVVAVWLCYIVGARIWSRAAGLIASALFALSPWAIIFSRKLWEQDLLPIVGGLFLLELHALLVQRRERAAATLVILAAIGTQLHFSAIVLCGLALYALGRGRRVVTRRSLSAGLGVAAVLWIPFLVLHGKGLLHPRAASVPPAVAHRFAHAIHLMAAIGGADGLSSFVSWQPAAAQAVSLALAVATFVGLAFAVRDARGEIRVVRGMTLVWYAAPAALLTILRTDAYIHYFIVLFPLPFIGLGYLVSRMRFRLRMAGFVLAAVLAVAFAATDVELAHRIAEHGGAPGDYGSAYRVKRSVAREIASHAHGRRVELSGNVAGGAYNVLLWNEHPNATSRPGPPARFAIVDRFASLPQPHAGQSLAHLGPIRILQEP
jgi:4-amino-4-deoxy-L-arabinose transferase-like glycosyltransferase